MITPATAEGIHEFRRKFDEKQVNRNRGRFAPKPGSAVPQATVVPKKKKAPAAHVYSKHGNGDVTHVSSDGSRRLVYNAGTGKFDAQERQADGTWATTASLGKGQTYQQVKSGDWQTAESADQDAQIAQTLITPPAPPQPVEVATPSPPTTPGAPVKPTAGLIHGKHPDGAVLFESPDGGQRLVWDGVSRKYLTQTRTDVGWETTETLSKSGAYQRYKGTSGWVAPATDEQVQTPEAPPQELDETPPQVLPGDDVVGPISTISGEPAITPVPPEVAPEVDVVETPAGSVAGYSEVMDASTPLTPVGAVVGPVPVIVANAPDTLGNTHIVNVDFAALRDAATAEEIAAAEQLNSGQKLSADETGARLAGAVADWTGADYPTAPKRRVGTTVFANQMQDALSGTGPQSTTATNFVRAVAAAPPNAPVLTRGMTNVPLHLIGEEDDVIATGPSSFTSDVDVAESFGKVSAHHLRQVQLGKMDASDLNEVSVTLRPGSRSLSIERHAGDYAYQREWVSMGQFRVVGRREEIVTRRQYHGSKKNFTDHQVTRYHIEIEQVA